MFYSFLSNLGDWDVIGSLVFGATTQEIERRRAMMRQRAHERKNEEMEIMEVEEEGKSGEESESESEYEEYTDSEDETEPRLKPVFIRKYEALSHGKSILSHYLQITKHSESLVIMSTIHSLAQFSCRCFFLSLSFAHFLQEGQGDCG